MIWIISPTGVVLLKRSLFSVPLRVGGLLSFVTIMALSFFINPVGRASWLFVKPPLLTQALCKARLCEKKYAPSAAREEDFFSANP